MSRNSKKNQVNANGSHPQESYKTHRQFLVRSLERNDVDIAALAELNRTLHDTKNNILSSCGELVLLDLGAGRLTLVNDELHEEKTDKDTHSLTPAQKEMCVDFLLRMKLRRKLANRLTRRLTRVAHSMDGSDVTPPPPPRYGDLRLNIDPSAVEARKEHWKRQEEARQKLLQARLSTPQPITEQEKTESTPPATESSPGPTPKEEPNEEPSDGVQDMDTSESEEKAEPKPQENAQEAQASAATDTQETETKVDTPEEAGPTVDKPEETEAKADKPEEAGTTVDKPEETETKADKPEEAGTTVDKPEEAEAKADKPEETETKADKPEETGTKTDKPEEANTKGDRPEETGTKTDKPEETENNSDKPGETTAEIKTDEVVPSPATVSPSSTTAPAGGPEAVGSSNMPSTEKSAFNNHATVPFLEEEIELLKDYDEAYEKVWVTAEKKFKYAVADKETAPDFSAIKNGMGIGASARIMSETEREQEHKRWQTAFLARIPQQPTFEELGLQNRVFCMKERRKRCLEDPGDDKGEEEETKESDTKKAKLENGNKEPTKGVNSSKPGGKELRKEADSEEGNGEEDENDNDESSDMFEQGDDSDANKESKKTSQGDDSSDMFDDEENEEKEESDPKLEKEEQGTEADEDTGDDKKEDEVDNDVQEEPVKRIRPMSLVAVPSFHEQDLARIKMIHGDLLGSSILEHARRRLSEVTNEYNNAFRMSNQLFEHRSRLQQNLNFFVTKSRTDLAKATNDHAIQVAMAKQRWLKEKKAHDNERLQQCLPSKWGRPSFGTPTTQNYQRNPGIPGVVGSCLADIVDGVVMLAEGKLPNKTFKDFVPPPAPLVNKQTGENLAQQHLRMEGELRRQLNECNTKFAASEEERKRSWKKMMKTKADLEIPTNQFGNRRGRLDMTNYHQVPLPPLRNSTQQVVPSELDYARSAMPSYTPPQTSGFPPGIVGGSDSKYSAARVRQRIGSDGTVAPVTEPKKTKDGLYQRPAGRTRKGMQWDAIRGIWVPEGSS